MYYHASQTEKIKILEPRISNHKIPLIYFSDRRENVLVYLSNSIEKLCKETNFEHTNPYTKWGPYSFNNEGKFVLEEYYPNATVETYKGVSGYIYSVNEVNGLEKLENIPHAYKTSIPVKIDNVEFIPDAYEAIMEEVNKGNIILLKYEEFIKIKKDWLLATITKEYEDVESTPEYKHFLKSKFDFLNRG